MGSELLPWVVGGVIAVGLVGAAFVLLLRAGAAEETQDEYDYEEMDEKGFSEATVDPGTSGDGGGGGDGSD